MMKGLYHNFCLKAQFPVAGKVIEKKNKYHYYKQCLFEGVLSCGEQENEYGEVLAMVQRFACFCGGQRFLCVAAEVARADDGVKTLGDQLVDGIGRGCGRP